MYEARAREIPSSRYSVADPGALFLYQQRVRAVVRLLVRYGYFPLGTTRILDVGCGTGGWLVDLDTWGATQSSLAGIDLSPTRVAEARRRVPFADIREGTGHVLPWDDQAFDLVIQSTVFSSILDPSMRVALAGEMTRVLAPAGAVLWYDFFRGNPRNPDVRGVKAAEVDRLFPDLDVSLKRVTLAPPLARRLVGRAWGLGLMLESARILNTHYLGLLRRGRVATR